MGVMKLRRCGSNLKVSRYSILLILISLASVIPAQAQSPQNYLLQDGSPTFSTADALPGGIGFVNVANGNLHVEIPLESSAQRGKVPYASILAYDSRLWYEAYNGTSYFWNNDPTSQYGGWDVSTTVDSGYWRAGDNTVVLCGSNAFQSWGTLSGFTWTGPDKTLHAFPIFVSSNHGCSGYSNVLTGDAWALDGTGLHMYVTVTQGSTYTQDTLAVTVYTADGAKLTPFDYDGNFLAAGTLEDSNGNTWTGNTLYNETPPVDTLARQPLTITLPSGGQWYTPPTSYSILNSDNKSVTIPVTFALIPIQTDFQVANVSEASGFSIYVLQTMSLPDGTSYSFTYDCDSSTGNKACSSPAGQAGYYGLMTGITLPTGGTITFAYANFNDANGNTNRWVSSRTSGGGTWTYAPALNCGTSCQNMTVTQPGGEQTLYTFMLNQGNGAWNTKAQYYGGPDSISSGLLETVSTTYQSYSTSAGLGGFAYTMPKTTTVTVPYISTSQNLVRKTTYAFDTISYTYNGSNYTGSLGKLITKSDYAFGNGSSGSLYRTTTYSYLDDSNSSYRTANIVHSPISIQLTNSGGSVIANTKICYDSNAACTGAGTFTSITAFDHDTTYGTTYTLRGNPTVIEGLVGGTTYLSEFLSYDTTGQLDSAQDSAGNTTTMSYTDNFYTDNGSNPPSTYTATHATNAYLTSLTQPLIGKTTFGYYYGTGKEAVSKDSNGGLTYSHFQDALDRLTTALLPNGGWILNGYTGQTQVDTYRSITSTSPSSSCSSCRHDQILLDTLGRITTSELVSDPDGPTTVATTYDGNGRVYTVTNPYRSTSDPTYNAWPISWDGLNRVTALGASPTLYGFQFGAIGVPGVTAQLCSASTYGTGYPIVGGFFTTHNGTERVYWIDAFGRVIETDEPNSSGGFTQNTCYSYDALDDLTQVTNGTQTRSYTYDALSRVLSATTPETENLTTQFSYTNSSSLCSGNPNAVCSRTDPRGVVTNYYYDAMNRPLGMSYVIPNGSSVSAMPNVCTTTTGISANVCYYYDQGTDQKGFRTKMTDPSGSTTWTYNLVGQVKTESRKIGGITKTLSYSYNLDGSLSSVTYPSSRVVNYTVSNAGRVVSVVDSNGTNYALGPATPPEYSPQGSLSNAIYGKVTNGFGGLSESRSYNALLAPTSITASSSAGTDLNLSLCYTALSFTTGCATKLGGSFAYYPSEHVVGVTNNLDTRRSQIFSVDTLDRISSALTQATSGVDCWGQSYTTDVRGNLTAITPTQCSTTALSTSSNNYNQLMGYSYDLAGNTTNDGKYSYVYDGENRISTANAVTYTYDGDGLRVEKSNGTLYWRSIAGETLAETDLSGNPVNDYVFFTGRRLARVNSGNDYYYFTDHLGTTRTITNSTGTVCYDADFTPYGQELVHTNSCSQNYKFTGDERDSETGLDYSVGRHYSSVLGRFMQADPLGGEVSDPQSLNRYPYASNNPHNYTDPTGFDDCSDNPLCFVLFGGVFGVDGGGDLSGGFTGGNGASLAGWTYSAKYGWGMLSPSQAETLFIYFVASQDRAPSAFSPPTSTATAFVQQSAGCSLSTGQRISLGIQGGLNSGLGAYKAIKGAIATVAGLSLLPESAGFSLPVFAGGVYATTSGSGQAATGISQLRRAFRGRGGPETIFEQRAAIASGPISGLALLGSGFSMEQAERAANFESAFTAGTGLINSSAISELIQSTVDSSLTAMGLANSGNCGPQ